MLLIIEKSSSKDNMNDSSFFSVGIVNDLRFTLHLTPVGHVETPKRVISIIEKLQKEKWLNPNTSITPREAEEEELNLAHSTAYIQTVKDEASSCQENEVKLLSTGDVFISSQSFKIAKLAVGAVLTAIDAVMENRFQSVFCVIRPPGHHACPSVGMGFCLFNNIAIGALYALKKYGIPRVLIVDWDVHHGNGTEAIIKNHPEVYYFSTHQALLWPFTGRTSEGNIKNICIPSGETSRSDVLQAYQNLAASMEIFQPELILISAGFDAHKNDPLGNLKLESHDFALLTGIIKEIATKYAKGRIISVLEGGYNLEGLSDSVVAHIKELAYLR